MTLEFKVEKPHFSPHKFGIDSLDEEHAQLVLLINRLSETLFQREHQDKFIALFNELITASISHFSSEEGLIKQTSNTDEILEHVKIHSDVLSSLLNLKAQYELDMLRFQIKYVNDMRRFTQHLFEQDAHLVAKIKNINTIIPFFVNETNKQA